MAHDYRRLQHWNQWLAHQHLGVDLLAEEQQLFAQLLERHFGKHALLIGVPEQYPLLNATQIPCHSLVTPLNSRQATTTIESDFHELPILTGSIDLVLLPHTLEFVANPRHLLAEACRVIKPEGLMLVSGFNPYGTWGLKKWFANGHATPWAGHMIPSRQLKNWLQLADFALEDHKSALYRPPIKQASMYKKLHFLECIGKTCFPAFGGVYVLQARAKVIPLTPIKMKWKQQLGGIPISSTITGHMAR